MYLIDADVVCYRIAFACKDEELEEVERALDEFVSNIIVLGADDCEDYQLFLTGSDNYRYQVATILPYKGNRQGSEKPMHFHDIRYRLEEVWGAIVVEGQEADDAMAIAATANPNNIIATVDKDLLQVPGRHYNFVKEEYKEVSEVEGLRFLYKQMLTGDRTDNIPGVHGIGDKKSDKILEGLTTEAELHEAVLEAYQGDIESMTENAILLYMRRKENEWWVPYPTRMKHFDGENPTYKPDYETYFKEYSQGV